MTRFLSLMAGMVPRGLIFRKKAVYGFRGMRLERSMMIYSWGILPMSKRHLTARAG